jgi:hypothetical protein
MGVLAFGDRAGGDYLLLPSALALIVGTLVFLVFIAWRLATEGVTPLSEKHQETVDASARATGEVIAHIMLGKLFRGSTDPKTPIIVNTLLAAAVGGLVGGSSAAGLAALIGQPGGTVFWLVVAFGIIVGAFLGFWYARPSNRGGTQTSEKTAAESPAGQSEAGGGLRAPGAYKDSD